MSVNAILVGPWIEALRPVRGKLAPAMAVIFNDPDRSDTQHTLATNILADFAADDPDRLAELLMVADTKAFLTLFPIAAQQATKILPVLRAELAEDNDVLLERSAAQSCDDKPRPRADAPVRAGPGGDCRPFRFLSDHAARRVPHEFGGASRLRIPPHSATAPCQWRDRSRSGDLGSRSTKLARLDGSDRPRGAATG